MKITLLTHCKELGKRYNTGQLVLEIMGDAAEQVCWDRLNPPARLVEEIDAGGVLHNSKLIIDCLQEQ